MSETTHENGPKPVTFYDVSIDEIRTVTQADVDLMLRRIAELAGFRQRVEILLDCNRVLMALPDYDAKADAAP